MQSKQQKKILELLARGPMKVSEVVYESFRKLNTEPVAALLARVLNDDPVSQLTLRLFLEETRQRYERSLDYPAPLSNTVAAKSLG